MVLLLLLIWLLIELLFVVDFVVDSSAVVETVAIVFGTVTFAVPILLFVHLYIPDT